MISKRWKTVIIFIYYYQLDCFNISLVGLSVISGMFPRRFLKCSFHLTHKQHFLMVSYTSTHQYWLTSNDLHASDLCRHWMVSRGPARSSELWEQMAGERVKCICAISTIWWGGLVLNLFGLVLWHINHCRLFNAKSILIHINSSISNNSV